MRASRAVVTAMAVIVVAMLSCHRSAVTPPANTVVWRSWATNSPLTGEMVHTQIEEKALCDSQPIITRWIDSRWSQTAHRGLALEYAIWECGICIASTSRGASNSAVTVLKIEPAAVAALRDGLDALPIRQVVATRYVPPDVSSANISMQTADGTFLFGWDECQREGSAIQVGIRPDTDHFLRVWTGSHALVGATYRGARVIGTGTVHSVPSCWMSTSDTSDDNPNVERAMLNLCVETRFEPTLASSFMVRDRRTNVPSGRTSLSR